MLYGWGPPLSAHHFATMITAGQSFLGGLVTHMRVKSRASRGEN
jgi:hypothetical protein